MYYVENNELKNDNRMLISKYQLDNINKCCFDKQYFMNCQYKHYNILECNFYINNKVFKYSVIFDEYNSLIEFRKYLEFYNKLYKC